MRKTVKIINSVIEIFNWIGMLTLVLMLLLVFSNTALRYLFNSPIPGTYELSCMAMICLTPSIAVTTIRKKSVWVDMLTVKMKRKAQLLLDAITLPICCVMWVFVTWSAYENAIKSITNQAFFSSINFPEWPFRLVFVVGMAMTTLAMISFAMDRLMTYKNGGSPLDKSEAEEAIEEMKKAEAIEGGADL